MATTASRRTMLSVVTAAAALPMPALARANASGATDLAARIVNSFADLPGRKALKVWAPAADGRPAFTAAWNAERALFCASAFKTYVLAALLKDLDAEGDQLDAALQEEARLDASVWSPGGTAFNPGRLSGKVTLLAACQAMIQDSDNTATDILLKHIGPARVRAFTRSIGLSARIPTSTRAFFAYVVGAPNFRTITWKQLVALLQSNPPFVHPFLNDVETMACSPNDFISYYERALQGRFFRHRSTLDQFKALLMTPPDIIRFAPPATDVFSKRGWADTVPFHALSIAGGAYIPERWIYFSFIVNWNQQELDPGPIPDLYFSKLRAIFGWLKEGLATG